MPARKGARVSSEMRMCPRHGCETEHRRYQRNAKEKAWDEDQGKMVLTGKVYRSYQWRCYPCLRQSISKNQRDNGVNVGSRSKMDQEAA